MTSLIEDIEAIKALKYRYTRCLDLKLWDEFTDCMTPDCSADYDGLAFGSRDALVDYMRTNMGSGLISMHHVHHPEISVDGDRASGVWYLHDKVFVAEFDFALEGAAFYDDHYVRTPQGWRISRTGYRRTFEASWSLKDQPTFKLTPHR